MIVVDLHDYRKRFHLTDEEMIRRHFVGGSHTELRWWKELTEMGADPNKAFKWINERLRDH